MRPEGWYRRAFDLFERARWLEASEWNAFLRAECGDDEELRREVSRRLAAGDLDATEVAVTRSRTDATRADPITRRVGTELGAYRLDEVLGVGGMGVVYAASRSDGEFEQRVAIKVLDIADPSLEARFVQERQILAQLEHPNIARMLDGGTTPEGKPYIVMEFVDGTPIDRYCQRQGLSVEERIRLVAQVAAAVHAAHRSLVVHRDLKPANILVTSEGVVKLLDFGIAKFLSETDTSLVTQELGRVFTPQYASPEQFLGRPITVESDVYQIGLLAFELLAGRRPYQVAGREPVEVQRLICSTEVDLPSRVCLAGGQEDPDRAKICRQLVGDLDTIVTKSLTKDPSQRYGSAKALADDLGRYLSGHPVRARRPTLAYRLGKLVQRHRRFSAAALVAGLLVAVLTGWAVLERQRATRDAELSRELEQVVRDIEWRMRVEQMAPLHPIAEAMRDVTEQLDKLAGLIQTLGPRAAGPGHFAMGRGLLATDQLEAAIESLEAARQTGYESPRLLATLGLAYGQMYVRQRSEALKLPDPVLRRAALTEAGVHWRDPAASLLAQAQPSELVSSEYLEALVAFYGERDEQALELAAEAVQKAPWFFEGLVLRGEILEGRAVELMNSGADPVSQQRAVRQAEDNYRAAREIAPSSLEAVYGSCRVGEIAMNMVVNSEIEGADGFWQRGSESCRAALVIAPDSIPAVSSLARLTQDWAYWTARAGGDPEPLFASSLQLSQRLLELDGGARGLAALAWHHTNYAVWKFRSGQAFRPDLERSVELLRQADALAPGEGSVRNSLVQTLAFRATRDLEDGFDASATTSEGLELARLEFADGVSIQSLNNLATLTVLYSRSQERLGIDSRDLLTEVLAHAESMAAEGNDVERALGRLRDRLRQIGVVDS